MARCTVIDTNPRLLPVHLAAQLLPGAFEHAVDHLLDHAIDRSGFDARFRNDTTGAPAHPPAVLLTVALCAYARGMRGSCGSATNASRRRPGTSRRGPWRGFDDVEFATLEWVAWFNTQRLLEPLGYVPPAEFEAQYHETQTTHTGVAGLN